MENLTESELGRKARGMYFCLGCSDPKPLGLVVCWDCFKSRVDVKPFKYWDGDLASWLNQVVALNNRKEE